jgi:hypothetical protein
MRHLAILALLTGLAAGCSAPSPTPTALPENATPLAITPPADTAEIVDLATGNLAETYGLAPNSVEVVSVEAVDWPDASLGCPQPGMAYAQVVTPGLRMTLQAEGWTYTYHADLAGQVVLCAQTGPTDSTPIPADGAEPYTY